MNELLTQSTKSSKPPKKHTAIVPLSGDRNVCTACGEHFNSTSAFSAHRVGDFGLFDGKAYLPHTRRCLTPSEMRAKGMCVNYSGFWITEPFKNQRWWEKSETTEQRRELQ